ncbi:NADP-dependent oxidoreductase [Nonlabens antarcticus]|uniref:NADP-dependent oxidoreductase n=1 Tax=Nonlabens antarcticus TaxID=392714 RepID=UPI0018910F97|nr:NADP-dependent oxidoreductase [Nonlabens antarcticus]
MAAYKNKEIVLAQHPEGIPTSDTFQINDIEKPDLLDGQVLLKSLYVSVDPGMRGFMDKGTDDAKGKKFEIGQPVTSRTVAQVLETKSKKFKKGAIVHGRLPWKIEMTSDVDDLEIVDESLDPISTAVSLLGVTGLAAYFGLVKIGLPKKGETIVVSGAAGSVGSTVVQIAKIMGCKVVGIAGSQAKISYLKDDLGADAGINYKETADMEAAINKACPEGVDVFFDNVGGNLFDAIFANINQKARIIICGQIADYNSGNPPSGPRPQHDLIKYSARMEGFVVFDYKDEFDEAKKQLAQWYQNDQLKYKENLIHGFENIPDAFIGLFKGENIGKQMIQVSEPE